MDKILSDYFLSEEQIDAINHAKGGLSLTVDKGTAQLHCIDGDEWFILSSINILIMFFQRQSKMPLIQILLIITQMASQSIGGLADSEEMSDVMHELIRRIADE